MTIDDIRKEHYADTLGGFSKERMNIEVLHKHRATLLAHIDKQKALMVGCVIAVKYYIKQLEESEPGFGVSSNLAHLSALDKWRELLAELEKLE